MQYVPTGHSIRCYKQTSLSFSPNTIEKSSSLRILTPPMETPDPPSDTPRASNKVFLTPHDIPKILRVQQKQIQCIISWHSQHRHIPSHLQLTRGIYIILAYYDIHWPSAKLAWQWKIFHKYNIVPGNSKSI